MWGPLGALAGGEKDVSKTFAEMGPISDQEYYANLDANNAFQGFKTMVGTGADQEDVYRSREASRKLAQMFQSASATGGLPSQDDINASNQFAQSMFGARRTGLEQSFQDQNTEMERLAARLGRPVNDPILQAKLRTGFMRQSDLLNAEQGAFASNFAMGLPERRLGYQAQAANVHGNLAYQAMQNRAALLGLGSQLGQQMFTNRYNLAPKVTESGGGFKGQVEGGTAGTAVDIEAFKTFGSMGMGMGGGGGGGGGAGNWAGMGAGGSPWSGMA